MRRNNTARVEAQALGPSPDKFADETPAQQAKHREIEREHRRRRGKRRPPKTFVRIRELERVFEDRYNGVVLPDDDSGLDDIFIMANHLAHFDAPDRRIREWLGEWAPWYADDKIAALLETVLRKPLKWTADRLAEHLRLNYATRERLGLTTIGSIDCRKARRAKLRKKRDAAQAKARRAKAGASPRAASAAQTEPWKALGISRATYYRRANHRPR